MSVHDVKDYAAREIEHGSQMLTSLVESNVGRAERAAQAGFDLAQEVYRFVQDPDGVGTEVLAMAYTAYMSLHSGNFGPEWVGPTR